MGLGHGLLQRTCHLSQKLASHFTSEIRELVRPRKNTSRRIDFNPNRRQPTSAGLAEHRAAAHEGIEQERISGAYVSISACTNCGENCPRHGNGLLRVLVVISSFA